MKTIKNFIAIFILFTSISASAQQISKAELQVTGLTCSMCSKATETSLRTLNFIADITPDLNKNLFLITFKKGNKVDIASIKDKVEDAGFSVGGMSAIIDFSQTKIGENGQVVVNGQNYQFTNLKSRVLDGEVKATVSDKDLKSKSTPVYRLSI